MLMVFLAEAALRAYGVKNLPVNHTTAFLLTSTEADRGPAERGPAGLHPVPRLPARLQLRHGGGPRAGAPHRLPAAAGRLPDRPDKLVGGSSLTLDICSS